MPLIYKIAPAALWRQAEDRGRFDGAPADIEDGFIHFSTAAQAEETAAKHFAGRTDLVLIAVDPKRLGDGLRYERLARRRAVSASLRAAAARRGGFRQAAAAEARRRP